MADFLLASVHRPKPVSGLSSHIISEQPRAKTVVNGIFSGSIQQIIITTTLRNKISYQISKNNQPLRLALGLALFSAPVACALAVSAAFPTDSLMSR
jgi:hypothetical protein